MLDLRTHEAQAADGYVVGLDWRDMTLHLMKQKIGRVSEVLGWIVVLLFVLGPWIAWFIGEPYRRHVVREGELCSPSHRWTYAQPKFADSDLSCEPE